MQVCSSSKLISSDSERFSAACVGLDSPVVGGRGGLVGGRGAAATEPLSLRSTLEQNYRGENRT